MDVLRDVQGLDPEPDGRVAGSTARAPVDAPTGAGEGVTGSQR